MLVFNLTDKALSFHGWTLPPDGGSVDIPSMDDFIPNRDLLLVDKKVISLYSLPKWWVQQKKAKVEAYVQKALEELKNQKILESQREVSVVLDTAEEITIGFVPGSKKMEDKKKK